ncbi:hypothetical protein H0E87_031521, partial [Populus deltoides]
MPNPASPGGGPVDELATQVQGALLGTAIQASPVAGSLMISESLGAVWAVQSARRGRGRRSLMIYE